MVACALKHQQRLSLSQQYTTPVQNCIVNWQSKDHTQGWPQNKTVTQTKRYVHLQYTQADKGLKSKQLVELALV